MRIKQPDSKAIAILFGLLGGGLFIALALIVLLFSWSDIFPGGRSRGVNVAALTGVFSLIMTGGVFLLFYAIAEALRDLRTEIRRLRGDMALRAPDAHYIGVLWDSDSPGTIDLPTDPARHKPRAQGPKWGGDATAEAASVRGSLRQ